MRPSPPRPGYTILELMLVMAIIIILVAVALPTMDAMYGDTRVWGAADEIRGAWAEARARAIESGSPYRFGVMKDKPWYRLAPDGPPFWGGSGGASEEEKDDGQEKVGSVPKGIKFNPPAGAPEDSGWVNVATFQPDGTCTDDARVEVQEKDQKLIIVLSIRGLTGLVSVKTKKQEEEDR